jgi:hypothetical protein
MHLQRPSTRRRVTSLPAAIRYRFLWDQAQHSTPHLDVYDDPDERRRQGQSPLELVWPGFSLAWNCGRRPACNASRSDAGRADDQGRDGAPLATRSAWAPSAVRKGPARRRYAPALRASCAPYLRAERLYSHGILGRWVGPSQQPSKLQRVNPFKNQHQCRSPEYLLAGISS